MDGHQSRCSPCCYIYPPHRLQDAVTFSFCVFQLDYKWISWQVNTFILGSILRTLNALDINGPFLRVPPDAETGSVRTLRLCNSSDNHKSVTTVQKRAGICQCERVTYITQLDDMLLQALRLEEAFKLAWTRYHIGELTPSSKVLRKAFKWIQEQICPAQSHYLCKFNFLSSGLTSATSTSFRHHLWKIPTAAFQTPCVFSVALFTDASWIEYVDCKCIHIFNAHKADKYRIEQSTQQRKAVRPSHPYRLWSSNQRQRFRKSISGKSVFLKALAGK